MRGGGFENLSLLFLLMNESGSRVVEKVSGLEKLTKKSEICLVNKY